MKLKEKVRSWLKKFINAYPVMAVIISILALIPLWIFIFIWWLLGPVTFWEKLAVIIIGGAFFGTIQIIFIIFGLYLLANLYDDWKSIKRSRAINSRK